MKILIPLLILINIVLNEGQECDPPTGLTAAINETTGNIEVSWDQHHDAIRYYMYITGPYKTTHPIDPNTRFYEIVNPDLKAIYSFAIRARCRSSICGVSDSESSKAKFGPARLARIGEGSVNMNWKMTYNHNTSTAVDVNKNFTTIFTLTDDIPIYYKTSFKGRIRYTGQTGYMSFNMQSITKQDAGYYKSSQSTIQTGGRVLVVLGKPTKPVIRHGRPIVGEPFALICDSQSTSKPDYYNPELKYSWLVNGSMQLNETRQSVRFNNHGNALRIAEVQKDDKVHTFSCRSSDQTQTSQESDLVAIDPLYPPRINGRIRPNIKYGLNLGDSITINISVTAHPIPNATWSTNSSGIVTENTQLQINVDTCIYSARINVQSHSNFGNYWVEFNNGIGNKEKMYFEILAQDRPLVPTNFKVAEVYSQMVMLSWISEFDGGLRQIFILECKEKGDNSIIIVNNVIDEGFGKTIEGVIWNLKANTSYHFKLYSKNNLGRSDVSEELEVRTKDAEQIEQVIVQTSSSNASIIGVSGVFVAIFVVVVVVLVVVLQMQRRKINKMKQRYKFKGVSGSSESQGRNIEEISDMDTIEYENSCRSRELAAEKPYDDLNPEDRVIAVDAPYTEINKRNPVTATDERMYEDVSDVVKGKVTKGNISSRARGKEPKGKISDKMYVNSRI